MEIRGEKLDAIGISSEQVDKKYVDSMTVSYGYVFSSEEKWNSVYDIAKAADKRMYKSKANFYREKKGIEENKAGAGFISCIGFTALSRLLCFSI